MFCLLSSVFASLYTLRSNRLFCPLNLRIIVCHLLLCHCVPIAAERCADGTVRLAVQAGAETFVCAFGVRPSRLMRLRAHMIAAEGFAFDHSEIVADACPRIFPLIRV